MDTSAEKTIRLFVRVEGVVQGVGFRPTVYRVARKLGLGGFVRNDALGLEIEVEGRDDAVGAFIATLEVEAPPLSRIDAVATRRLTPRGDLEFAIVSSSEGATPTVAVTPDAHVCDDCLSELFDPSDRRYRYPFINCTACGPRYSIVRAIPYDRPNTTMAEFPLCSDCRREYEDPGDRRFHAQPVACPVCGPRVRLVTSEGRAIATDDAVGEARRRLRQGQIVAIKGIGGFHLAADATSEEAVSELRRRKGRVGGKPFAVMVRDVEQAESVVVVDDRTAAILQSPSRPIVLLDRRPGSSVAHSTAPGLGTLGAMLPSSPLHYLLLEPPMPPLIMTSGNPSSEPITIDDDEAVRRLGPLCDALLLHDREIRNGCDDSVVQVVTALENQPVQVIRRARGYVPRPLVPSSLEVPGGVLGVGGEMKGAFCLSRPGQLVMGRHLGDLEGGAARQAFRKDLDLFGELLGVEVRLVAHDLHPDYFTTRLAAELRERRGVELVGVQHHQAHLASALAEAGVAPDEAVVGVIYDGTGYGDPERVWGGELLVGTMAGSRSVAHLRPLALPGGDRAIRAPWRAAVSALLDALGPGALEIDLPPLRGRDARLVGDLQRMIERKLGCPRSSGLGRLFDVAAALVGLPGGLADPIGYDAQPALELEAAAWRAERAGSEVPEVPSLEVGEDGEIDTRPLVRGLVQLLLDGAARDTAALWFHHAIARATVNLANALAERHGVGVVALSGGCFHNRWLTSQVTRRLDARGRRVVCNERVSCGDGGLALGQVATVCAREMLGRV